MYTDITGYSWTSDIWDNICVWFSNTFGGVIYKEKSFTSYFFVYETRTGIGYGNPSDKPVVFYVNIPDVWWKLDQYSVGVKFTNKEGNGFKLFAGTTSGFGWFNKDFGTTISNSFWAE
jgi:hypothetical protein